jgi:hypothetical protein
LSTAPEEMRIGGFNGNCFRCGEYGHWAESESCPWLKRAATQAEHYARLDAFRERYWAFEITPFQKRAFITAENEMWHSVPARSST